MNTPELDKQRKVLDSGEADTLANFYDWLESKGYAICEYVRYEGYRDDQLQPIRATPEQLFAEFFGIDLKKIEQERRAILRAVRNAS